MSSTVEVLDELVALHQRDKLVALHRRLLEEVLQLHIAEVTEVYSHYQAEGLSVGNLMVFLHVDDDDNGIMFFRFRNELAPGYPGNVDPRTVSPSENHSWVMTEIAESAMLWEMHLSAEKIVAPSTPRDVVLFEEPVVVGINSPGGSA